VDSILQLETVHKNFGGIKAIDGLDIQVEKNRIVGLIGPNGSGKTTVLNVVTGVYNPEQGQVRFNNEEIQGLKPHEVCRKGISRTFQNIRMIASQTVFSNVHLGAHVKTHCNLGDAVFRSPRYKNELNEQTEKINEILDFIGLYDIKDEWIKNVPYGKRKVLEIGRALMAEPQLLLLDEPAAGLNSQEKRNLMELVNKIHDRGITILLIEHAMEFVEGLTHKTIVINYGKKIAEGSYSEIKNDPEVITAYLGTRRD